ncbi:hypothetical protein ACTI_49970 [Actinoplanes sp. OR16]|nr:hypothetical protein ACTI_49970 [Actinoplanes sp. OR16]
MPKVATSQAGETFAVDAVDAVTTVEPLRVVVLNAEAVHDPNSGEDEQNKHPNIGGQNERRPERSASNEMPRRGEVAAYERAKIDRYRAALDAGGDPTLTAGWITETTAIKKAAQARSMSPTRHPSG